jgi:glucokinase
MSGDATYLVIDVGGTKTLLAVFADDDESLTPLTQARYASREYGGVGEIITEFLEHDSHRPGSVVVDVAGVVQDAASARVTNLPWEITKQQLNDLGFADVVLLNDMTALTASLPLLRPQDLFCLHEGQVSGAVSAVMAPGTGLGEGFLHQVGDACYPVGCEGGHCDFGPIGQEQLQLAAWLARRSDEIVSYEAVAAGPAIGTLYDFCLAQGQDSSERVRLALRNATDRTPIIVDNAIDGTCPACTRAVDLFLSILGRESVNLILKLCATRGLFLGGSILPRLAKQYAMAPFLAAFNQPGPMAELLSRVPVNIIVRPDAVLLGAASYGRNRLISGSRT